ncbi:MAG: peptidylprolyl isomerase [Alistipes sp.]|nr:peptidylprolyl isomerase [Alistipes sp.]MBQ5691822.1 peptidylprolyl isomerase [Alistipes sp.]
MKRVLLTFLTIVGIAASLYAEKHFVMLDKVVAVVGNSSIMYSEIDQVARQLVEARRAEGYTSDRDPKNEALEQLLMQKLLYNQALIDSIDVNTGDIVQRVEMRVQQMSDEAGSVLELERKSHMPIYHIRELIRRQMEEQAYATAMQQDVISKVKVVPGEVETFYKGTTKEDLPIIAEQYVYAHITKYPKGMDAAKRRTRERLLDMRERIVTGKAQFATLARMYSIDGAAIRGGELEPTPLSGWVKPFADAVEELKPGQVSEVVETQFGLHIVQLIDKRGNLYHCRHIVLRPTFTTDEIVTPLLELDSLANLIRKDSLTFEAAALAHSDDKHSKQNGGIVTNHDLLEHYSAFDAKLTATKFLKEDFGIGGGKSIDDYNAIRYMNKGDISTAFRTTDMNGNEMCKIIKLVDIIPSHIASLDEDYLRLEQIALEDKQQKTLEKWLNEKINAMYIYISPEFRDGEFLNKNWVKKEQK